MRIIDVEQGTPEWFQARLGIPTASRFGMILTPTGKQSTQADKYIDKLVAEYLAGQPLEEDIHSYYIDRGVLLEPDARREYEFTNSNDVVKVGLCLSDDGSYGASPDGLISDNGTLELKCPKHNTMLENYRKGFPGKYKPQVQGQLWVCEREYCDFYAYHPLLMPFIVRVNRDDEYIKKLAEAVSEFNEKLEEAKESLKEFKV